MYPLQITIGFAVMLTTSQVFDLDLLDSPSMSSHLLCDEPHCKRKVNVMFHINKHKVMEVQLFALEMSI